MSCVICLFGCLAVCGCKNTVGAKLSFFPPMPPRYCLQGELDDELQQEIKEKLKRCKKIQKIKSVKNKYRPTTSGKYEGSFWLIDDQGNLITPKDAYAVQTDIYFLNNGRGNILCSFFHRCDEAKYTILFSHGNSTDIGLTRNHLVDLAQNLKVNILSYDYSGYGLSTGHPSEVNVYADIRAAYDFLVHDEGIAWNTILVYGQSVGTVPSIDLASDTDYPIGGLILHSPLISGISVVQTPKKPKLRSFDIFKNLEKLPRSRSPCFIIHGLNDSVIPVSHGEMLYKVLQKSYPPWWVSAGDHNLIEIRFRPEYISRLGSFIDYLRIQQMGLSESELLFKFRALRPTVIKKKSRPSSARGANSKFKREILVNSKRGSGSEEGVNLTTLPKDSVFGASSRDLQGDSLHQEDSTLAVSQNITMSSHNNMK